MKKDRQKHEQLVRIGENIRRRREKLCMSQTELANRIGSERARISGYENGEREMGIVKLLEIAKALNCTVDEICRQKNEMYTKDDLLKAIENLNLLPSDEIDRIIGFINDMIAGVGKRCGIQ